MSEGTKYDQDKLRMDLIPLEAMEGLARVLGFGAAKYGDRNWEKGIRYSRVYGALLRHVTAWFNGEDLDPESGLNHLDHVLACVSFLSTYVARDYLDLDDRPNRSEHLQPEREELSVLFGRAVDEAINEKWMPRGPEEGSDD